MAIVAKRVGQGTAGVMDMLSRAFSPQVDEIKKTVQDEAGKGAEAAVKPWIYAALGVSGLALIVGLVAISRTSK